MQKVAISDKRILAIDDKTVTIRVKDRKDNNKQKELILSGIEFIRRFLIHALPSGFIKVLYYGILANCNKKTKLKLCQKLSGSGIHRIKYAKLSTIELLSKIIGKDLTKCPSCEKGKLEKSAYLNSAHV